ncbi:MAG: carbohydrate kinase family protein [Planctomycetes bacterium]|nr:carbohydrate kinase family protein [Planctomycetota bacterium]
MGRPIDAVVAGHLCFDVYPSFASLDGADNALDKVLIPGKLVEVGPMTVSTGGPVSNTGLALLQLGINTVLMGKVGTDAFGTLVKKGLAERKADEHLIVIEGESTSYTIGIAIPGVDRIFLHHPGSNDTFCADDVNYDIAAQARLFHFGYPPLMKKMYEGGDQLATIMRRVRELGTITSLDMALPDPNSPAGKVDWEKMLRENLPYVDIFLPSAEETLFMLDRPKFDRIKAQGGDMLDSLTADDIDVLAEKLLAYGCKVAVIKCGHRGLYVRAGELCTDCGSTVPRECWKHRELWEPPFTPDKLVSAAGSGDSAIAGFLAAFLRDLPIEQCLRYATAAGAENVEAMDAVSGVGTWDEITSRIGAGWPKAKLEIASAGWSFDDDKQLWIGPKDRKEPKQ